MTLPTNHRFSTSDTALATYLICEGYVLEDIDYSQPRYEFRFKNDGPKIQEHVRLYLTSKALVDPATFTRVNRKLTRLLKNQLQWWDEV